jgi:outer membrane autotransporter protein
VRPEIPDYTMTPVIGREMGLAALGTFHQRQGDQMLLDDSGVMPGVWGRVFGEKRKQTSDQTVEGSNFQLAASFDGQITGVQVGFDLYADHPEGDRQNRVGVYYARVDMEGDIRGNVLARVAQTAGKLDGWSDNAGLYATHIGKTGWYVDLVGQYSWLNINATSYRRYGVDFDGHGLLASIEAGKPYALSARWTIEPQAQLIWQRVNVQPARDPFSTIDLGKFDTLTGRFGARLEGKTRWGGMDVQPFLEANLWHDFDRTNVTTFNEGHIDVHDRANLLKLGGGLAARISASVSVYGAVDWGTNLGDDHYRTYGGNLGVRIKW